MQFFALYENSIGGGIFDFKIETAIRKGKFEISVEKDTGLIPFTETTVILTPEQFQTFVDSCNDLIAVSKGEFPFKPGWAYSCHHAQPVKTGF